MCSHFKSAVLAALLLVMFAPAALAVEVGQSAPKFNLSSVDGKGKVNLESYRGKVVYLDFWASWCPPCRKAMPQIEQMRKDYSSDEFAVVAVNLDNDLKKAHKVLAKEPVGYVSGSDPKQNLPKRYEIKTMPTAYLIDRNGVIRYIHEGFRKGDEKEIRAEIDKLLRAKR